MEVFILKLKGFKFLALALVTALTLTACGGGGGTSDKGGGEKKPDNNTPAATDVATPQVNRIVSSNMAEPGTLDPAKARGTHESWPLQHLFVGLTRVNKDGKVENALADKIEISEDGKVYKVTLKDGLKWSDGNPITAEDFEFAWKRVLDPKMESQYAYQLYYIAGAEEYNKGKGKADSVGVKAVDAKTLQVTLKQPTAYFDSLMGFYTYYPVSKKVVEANADWAKDPKTLVSNGAFTLKDWTHNSKIVMDKNPNYYEADKVKIDGIDLDIIEDQSTVYQKYVAGEYNMVVELPTEVTAKLRAENNPELVIGPNVALYYYNLNPAVKPLNNVKVRKALSLALDRKVITDQITQGGQLPATAIVPPGLLDDTGKEFSDANKDLIKTDVEEAKKLLTEGLAEEKMTPADVKLTILYNTSENHKKIAEAIQQMWNKELGINTTLENVEFKVKIDRENAHQFDISRSGWVGDYLDPMTFMDLWITGASNNYVNYSNPEYDKLVKEAQTSTDQKLRMDNMKKAEKMILEDMAIVPIYFYTHPYAVKPNVKGITKNAINYPSLINAEIELKK
ncbi:oligopeptide-binding protein OppA [[Eubacterium] yurii subsp. margaretiae ATCC 43715]|nr:oligopeptide-binding protein OppA [[Eubacterium] yurii subsp. margaretiae ATCC 43715]